MPSNLTPPPPPKGVTFLNDPPPPPAGVSFIESKPASQIKAPNEGLGKPPVGARPRVVELGGPDDSNAGLFDRTMYNLTHFLADTPESGTKAIAGGVQKMAAPGMENKAQGLHEVVGGVGRLATPWLAPVVATNPVGAALGMGGGYLAQKGTTEGLKKAGVPEGYANLAGDVAGMGGGYAATRKPVVDFVRAAPGKVANAAGNVASEIVGRTTGVGPKPFRQAATNPSPDLVNQMRDPDTGEIIQHLKEAAQNVKDSRGSQYAKDLANLSQNQQPISNQPIIQALDQKLGDFRVARIPNPPSNMNPTQFQQWQAQYGNASPGELDFSASPIGDAGQKDISAIDNLIRNWKDWSPVGADALKRRLDDFYSDSGQARAMVTALRGDVKNAIVNQVPEYGDMTANYAKVSKFLNDLGDLSLNSKNAGTPIRKLTTLLNQNNDYREGLIDALQAFANSDIKGEMAGLALSRPGPRGIAGPISGSGLLYAIIHGTVNPSYAAGLAAASPRLMGELAVAMGKAAPYLKQAGTAIPNQPIAPAIGAAIGTMRPPDNSKRMPPPGAR